MKIVVKTYEESRLEFFKDLARKAEKKLDKCIKAMKKSDYNNPLSEAQIALDDAVEKKGFYCDIVDMLCTDKPSGWISVNDRLPEKHVGVLVYNGSIHEDFICSSGYFYDTLDVTHWMPLPEPPKESEGNTN